jgi:hypothetical protein
MKKLYTLITVLTAAALISTELKAQMSYTFGLGSSFSPSWSAGSTSGSASNINASGINCTVSMAITGYGSLSSPYPRVNKNNSNSSDFVVQNSTDAMEIDVNFGNRTSYIDVTYTFSAPVQNVSFGISDIDRPSGSSPYTYADQVTVTGGSTSGTVIPTLTKYNTSSNIVTISGNVATATTGYGGGTVSSLTQNSSDQNGTIFVSFNGNAITSITIRYGNINSSSVSSNPGLQAIAIGNLSFQKAFAPVTTDFTNTDLLNTDTATLISALPGTDDESIASFTITTIPPVSAGVLYYFNGTNYVPVTAGLDLTPAQAASLKFDPSASYNGITSFKFTATDNRGLVSSAAVYKIPVQISALPIILSSFSALLDNNIVKLSWTTEQESNSNKFIIEKSVDGNNWQTLTIVKAVGNSSSISNYSTTDGQPAPMNYYRLKMVDLDGSFVYSKVLRVSKKEMTIGAVKIFPNPVVNSAAVSITSSATETVSVKVFSNNGMMVKEITSQLNAGVTNIDVPGVSQLSRGIYTVVINDQSGSRKGTVQFVKQ